ncbi:MAG: 4-sulfomuconolactone hydrolase [Candidatus Moanabacter tarae]|uniref:4-sulfomuconolactone hydrolase n=1 Tax=Candidatus Moanibacter tarae TaxID=2200854 RepID=A0A2Z4AE80_9BACT|nr:MAG: 4-sulfomuconolactone hydrolase [Candidatus Moanabacter tarae]|tara:strand:+ start:55893 stop:56696 length:804 start_codon:yes stop_codon:yes gene_type:complete
MIVDSHLHIWSEDTEQYPRTKTPYPGSVELLLEYMDESGVDRAVIVLPVHYQYDNRILADTLKIHDGKFAGVGVVYPQGPSAADTLSRLVEEEGIRGVRIRGPIEPECFCKPDTEPLWKRATELSAIICILATPDQVPAMKQMIQRFPDATVVIDHFAQIPAVDGIDCEAFQTFLSLSEFPKVHIKFSGLHYWGDLAYPHYRAQKNLRAAFDAFGTNRILWGSDWPHILPNGGYIRCLNFVGQELNWISDEGKTAILGGNSLRLWWD